MANNPEDGYYVDRKTHWYIIGRSQSGKTTFMKNLMLGDMLEPERPGLCFIDLHGDCALEILSIVPRERIQDVIYYDPLSPHAPAFNFLKFSGDPSDIAGDLENLFQKFSTSWGTRLAQLLRNCLLALMYDMRDNGKVWTLRDVKTFLIHKEFRSDIISRLRPSLAEFWEYEFPTFGKDAINPVTNKLDELIPPESKLERVFSEPDNEIDFDEIMNSGKILICRFAKGELKEEPAAMLGIIFTRAIQQAALARSKIPIHARKPFFLLVDECQNLVAGPLDSIMTETAKFRVFLTLAHHRLSQFRNNPDLRDAVMGATVLTTFRLYEEDIPVFQKHMHRVDSVYRVRGRGEYKPVSNFIIKARGILAEEYEESEKQLTSAPQGSDDARHYEILRSEVTGAFNALRNENIGINALDEITHQQYGVIPRWRGVWGDVHEHRGKRLFPDCEFKEVAFPSYEQFANLPAHQAYIRVDRASHVFEVATPPPPREDLRIRQAILTEHQRQYAERVARQKTTPPPPTPESPLPRTEEQPTARHYAPTREKEPAAPPPPRKRKKPKDDEDFLN